MVSISWPCDPLSSASQSAGITGVSHRARPSNNFWWKSFKNMCFPACVDKLRLSPIEMHWSVQDCGPFTTSPSLLLLSKCWFCKFSSLAVRIKGQDRYNNYNILEAKAGRLLVSGSLRPAWATWQDTVSTKNTKISWAWWCTPGVPANPEAKVRGSLEPRRSRLQWAEVTPLHCSLGDRARFCLKQTNKKNLCRPAGQRYNIFKVQKEQSSHLWILYPVKISYKN